MEKCIKCKEIKYWFLFYNELGALYTVASNICKKCANNLRSEAVSNYSKVYEQTKNSK